MSDKGEHPRIVLVRHANAKNRAPGLPDIDRPLTGKGVRVFEALLPQAVAHLNGQRLALWTSHALRARQTAELLAQALAINDMETHDWIYDGDWAQLEAALKAPREKVDAVIIVGHQPWRSDWAARISGQDIPFRKGEMACFDSPWSTGAGKIRWRVTQP
ncbi:MAG: hypothetical protein GX810_02820 [Clostridiales bacterium]|nr:hypothetical protein [Clostridiales bacterium]